MVTQHHVVELELSEGGARQAATTRTSVPKIPVPNSRLFPIPILNPFFRHHHHRVDKANMSHNGKDIRFDFDTEAHARPELEKCTSRSPAPPVSDAHVSHLNILSLELGSPTQALRNARYLAAGSPDLVVILLEPSNWEATHLYENEILEVYPPTIQILDKSLRLASNNLRSIDNTVILDSRPLRLKEQRESETLENRNERDDAAHRTLKRMLGLLRPKVIQKYASAKTTPAPASRTFSAPRYKDLEK